MDKIKLNEILTMDNSIVSMQDLVNIDRLCIKYPYCSVFRVLGVKFAYIVNSFNKLQWLESTSVYVSDREYLKNILSNITVRKHEIPTEKKEDIISKINAYQDEQLSSNPTKQELLDKFLKIENPKPLGNSNVEYDNSNIEKAIKQSADDTFKIVTETMAKVYAKQGNKQKAIKIYQQLIKLKPEKETYFINQIELLKK